MTPASRCRRLMRWPGSCAPSACPARTSRQKRTSAPPGTAACWPGGGCWSLLDNAGSVEQVRPLLPGSPACAAVVTSRDALAGLVARDGAVRLDLDLLPLADAVGLLRALIGARVDADPGAAAALADPVLSAAAGAAGSRRARRRPPGRAAGRAGRRAGRPAARGWTCSMPAGTRAPRCARCSPGPTATWTPVPPARSGCWACTPARTSTRTRPPRSPAPASKTPAGP